MNYRCSLVSLAAIALSCGTGANAMEVRGTFAATVNTSHLAGVNVGDLVSGNFVVDTDKAPPAHNTPNRSDYSGTTVRWLEYEIAFNGLTYFDTKAFASLPNDGALIIRIDDQPNGPDQARDRFLLQLNAHLPNNGRAFISLTVVQLVDGMHSPLMQSTALDAPVSFDAQTAIGNISSVSGFSYSPNSTLTDSAGFALNSLSVSAIPEPGAPWLLLSGLCVIFAASRSRSTGRVCRARTSEA